MTKCKCDGKKALEIILAIKNCCNEHDITISFDRDIGDNTLTILFDDHYTHVGTSSGTESELIDSLHDLFVKNSGLSVK